MVGVREDTIGLAQFNKSHKGIAIDHAFESLERCVAKPLLLWIHHELFVP